MNAPDTKAFVSAKRKRNFIAKKMKETVTFHQKIHDGSPSKEKKLKPWELLDETEQEA